MQLLAARGWEWIKSSSEVKCFEMAFKQVIDVALRIFTGMTFQICGAA